MDILSMCGLYDPSTKKGLMIEGGLAAKDGIKREDNPYAKSHPGSLAEEHWAEGWDSFTAFLAKRTKEMSV